MLSIKKMKLLTIFIFAILLFSNTSFSQNQSALKNPSSSYYSAKNFQPTSFYLFQTGINHFNKKRYGTAISYLTKFVQSKTPINDYGHYYLGLSYYHLNQYRNAQLYLNIVRTRYPYSAFHSEAIEYLGKCYLNTSQGDKIIQDFTVSDSQSISANIRYLYYSGLVYEAKKQFNKALLNYLQILEVIETDKRWTEDCINRIEKISQNVSNFYKQDKLVHLGIGYYRLENYKQSLLLLQKLGTLNDRNENYLRHFHVALCYLKTKQVDKAVKILKWLMKEYKLPQQIIPTAYQYYRLFESSKPGIAIQGYEKIVKSYRKSDQVISIAKKLVVYYNQFGNDRKKAEYLSILADHNQYNYIWDHLFSDINNKKINSVVTYYPNIVKRLTNEKAKAKLYYWIGTCALSQNRLSIAEQYFSKSYLSYMYNYYSYKSLLYIKKYNSLGKFRTTFKGLRAKIKQNRTSFFRNREFLRKYRLSMTPLNGKNNHPIFQRVIYFFEAKDSKLANYELNRLEEEVSDSPKYFRALSYYFHNNKDFLKSIRYSFKLVDYLNTERGHNFIPPDLARFCFPRHYESIVSKYSKEYKTDKFLIFALIREESRFNYSAHSWAGARGVMQIMPATGRMIAKKIGIRKFNLYDLETNIRFGIYYIASLIERFESYSYALAGYNGGPGRIARHVSTYSKKDYILNGEHLIELIPVRETRLYVKKVMRSYFSYLDIYNQID